MRRMKRRIALMVSLGLTAILLETPPVWSQEEPDVPPVVSNVRASQRTDGSKIVDIYYDLTDLDGDPCTIWAFASCDNGQTWTVVVQNATGHIGTNINPGMNRKIVWDCRTDLPGWFGQLRVRVFADDGQGVSMAPVPGGEYCMGDHHDGMSNALPLHWIYTDAFFIDQCEVTNQQYLEGLNWARQQGLIYYREQ